MGLAFEFVTSEERDISSECPSAVARALEFIAATCASGDPINLWAEPLDTRESRSTGVSGRKLAGPSMSLAYGLSYLARHWLPKGPLLDLSWQPIWATGLLSRHGIAEVSSETFSQKLALFRRWVSDVPGRHAFIVPLANWRRYALSHSKPSNVRVVTVSDLRGATVGKGPETGSEGLIIVVGPEKKACDNLLSTFFIVDTDVTWETRHRSYGLAIAEITRKNALVRWTALSLMAVQLAIGAPRLEEHNRGIDPIQIVAPLTMVALAGMISTWFIVDVAGDHRRMLFPRLRLIEAMVWELLVGAGILGTVWFVRGGISTLALLVSVVAAHMLALRVDVGGASSSPWKTLRESWAPLLASLWTPLAVPFVLASGMMLARYIRWLPTQLAQTRARRYELLKLGRLYLAITILGISLRACGETRGNADGSVSFYLVPERYAPWIVGNVYEWHWGFVAACFIASVVAIGMGGLAEKLGAFWALGSRIVGDLRMPPNARRGATQDKQRPSGGRDRGAQQSGHKGAAAATDCGAAFPRRDSGKW